MSIRDDGVVVETFRNERVGSFYIDHPRVQLNAPESMTKTEFAEEADLNVLMKRYGAGAFTATPLNPRFLDADDLPDLQEAMQLMIDAESSFNSLPAEVRKEFDNDGIAFVKFATDPANRERLEQWGLTAPAEAPPDPVEVRFAPEEFERLSAAREEQVDRSADRLPPVKPAAPRSPAR